MHTIQYLVFKISADVSQFVRFSFRFNEVLVDSGILLIHPLLKASSKVSVMQQAASRVTKDKMKSLLRRRPRRMMTTLPDIICGNQVQIQDTRQRYWSSQVKYLYYVQSKWTKSFLARGKLCRPLKMFPNSLDPDQDYIKKN